MSFILALLGLKVNPSDPLAEPGNLAPYHNLFNFLFAYVVLSARVGKMMLKIDHNVNPRLDLAKYGERAVTEGKMTRRQLNFLQRNESCHANSMEHFPVFAAASIFATISGVKTTKINTACAIYTAARITYAIAYLSTERVKFTSVRSLAWWTSNAACIYMLWSAGKVMHGAKLD